LGYWQRLVWADGFKDGIENLSASKEEKERLLRTLRILDGQILDDLHVYRTGLPGDALAYDGLPDDIWAADVPESDLSVTYVDRSDGRRYMLTCARRS
jgi:hypothetical protein